MHLTRLIRPVVLFAVVVVAAGCSSFDRDWAALGQTPDPGPGLKGRWAGTWTSDTNGHTGDLRCIITSNEEGTLRARYHATYGMGLTFEYAMPMEVEFDGAVYRFSAEHDLGVLAGGVYTYEGTVQGDVFYSTYDSKGDKGVFEMTRLADALPAEE